MSEFYLFDWGDTLMIDFPDIPGKMCDWDHIEAVEGSKEALKHLSKNSKIYIATGAAESTEEDIKKAFMRVGLDKYITGYFCKENIGIAKGNPEFLKSIIKKLSVKPEQITMVGDNFEIDIKPALKSGINAIWLSKDNSLDMDERFRRISSLKELSG